MVKEVKKDVRTRGWCITVHDVDDDAYIAITNMFESDENCTYLIVGFEIAARTKAFHLQCYIYYTNPLRWNEMKNYIEEQGYSWHFEAQKAKKNVEAYAYCMEDGKYVEFGDRPRQGHRTDLQVIMHDIDAGRPEIEIAQNYFSQWCQYGKRFDAYRELIKPKYVTVMQWYDRLKPMQCMTKIRSYYDNYYIVKGFVDWIEICELVISGKYKTVFIPNLPGYGDYDTDDIGSDLFDDAVEDREL